MKNNTNQILIFVAVVLLALAVGFNGYAYLMTEKTTVSETGDLSKQIEKGIMAYIEKQQEEERRRQEEANKPQLVEGDFTDDDAVLGDPNAPITIVEFSDYECPYCQRHFRETHGQLKEKYIDTGKVKLIFRDFPLSFHADAEPAANAAECVREQLGDKGYFTYHDVVFEKANQGLQVANLIKWGVEVGASESKLKTCIEEGRFKDEIAKDFADGQRAGVTGTPAFLINNIRVSGAMPFEVFEEVIEEELKK